MIKQYDYLSPSFQKAIHEGYVVWGSFETKETFNGDDIHLVPHEGWMTRRFAVADEKLTTYNPNNRDYKCVGYTVTHLDTGFSASAFDVHHVALNFMLELERCLPENEFSDHSDLFYNFLKTRGMHEAQLFIYGG